jgi:hypothetical protein
MLVKIKINIFSEIGYYILRIIGRIPDRVMLFILNIIDRITKYFKFEIVNFYIKDLINVYKIGKPYTKIVRDILTNLILFTLS